MLKRIVIDTNVLVSAMRSRRGASFKLLSLVGEGRFDIAVSVPLVLEYEQVLMAQISELSLSERDVGALLDYLCLVGHRQEIFFLWRPQLPDPRDDLVLELAVNAECSSIVTFNLRHFRGADRFGVKAVEPAIFLREIGELQ